MIHLRVIRLIFPALMLCAWAQPPSPAVAAAASELRSGVATFGGAIGLVTVPLFVVPSGQRFVLTDVTWSAGTYPTGFAGLPSGSVRLWIQDASNNVRHFQNVYFGASPAASTYQGPVRLSLASGIVFESSQVVTFGLSSGMSESWSASWSGYLESVSVSAVDTPPAEHLAFEAFPNPSGSKVVLQFRLARSGKTTLAIFDARGRKVRSLEEQVRVEGWNAVEWDGRDDRGRAVRAGTYFARLETPESAATEKLIQMR